MAPDPVPRMNISECSLDEPMTLTVRIRRDGKWVVGHRRFPGWREAIMGAFVAMTRIPSTAHSIAQGYFADFKDGTYRPQREPWWSASDGAAIVSVWPSRYLANYEARVRAGYGHPLPGDEYLLQASNPEPQETHA